MSNVPRPPDSRRQGRQESNGNRLQGIYGDHLKQKRNGMVRILFNNPQGLGPIRNRDQCQSFKINKLKDTLLKHNIDIMGLSEVNKDWRMIPQKQTLWQLTEGWFEYRRMITSLNSMVPPTSQTQYGGTAMMVNNKVAYSIMEMKADARNLGRWSSILLKGKNQKLCRIICAYCPCISTGPSSTYTLQVVGLSRQNTYTCPRIQFWTDLQAYIEQCQNANEQLIVMGDWNSDYDQLLTWMQQFGLHDIIQSRHGSQTPPPTCHRSSGGPIDAIFATNIIPCWRGGYLAFDYLESDHRGLWCDIPIEFLLGYNMQHPAHPQARRLKTTDPRIKKKYISLLHTALRNNNIYEKFDSMYQSMQVSVLPTDLLKYEELDTIITTAMQEAERKCRKLRTGIVKWSPLYQKACDRVTYWKLVDKYGKGERINTRKLISLRNKLGIKEGSLTAEEIGLKLRQAIRDRKKCKAYAPELQMEYRHRLAKAKEEEDNIPASIHVKNLTKQEDTRILFRRIRYLEKKMSNLSTSRITVKSSNGKQKDIIQKELMERYIIAANEKKYHQTEGHGKLQKGKLLRDIGVMGSGPATRGILMGTYKPPASTDQCTKQFLAKLKCPTNATKLPVVSFQEFCTGWSKAKERTSSNGLHFGHYKASLGHPQIAQLLYKRSLIPMITGYSPIRHRQGTDVMLLKKENSYDVDRLRTIVLFDSEANMNYKHIGRRAMNAAIKLNQVVTEQYSRPHRKAIDHAINRRIVMDHQLYLRQPYALVSCDLKGCYDRITHSPASLALQRVGVPQTEAVSMFTSIQRMTHKVRTGFGDSKQSYGGEEDDRRWKLPPQGVLQGNGSGPSIWSLLSSVIFMVMKDKGHRNKITSSLRKFIIELAGFAYVDDTDLFHTDTNIDRVVQRMQQKLNDWNDMVGVTGGILSPEKCWWYLVTFRYISGKWMACQPLQDFKLWIRDELKRNTEITQIHPSESSNMLGVHMSPDGNNKAQVAALREKAERWAQCMKESRANREEVWTSLHRTIPFSICYPLPAVTLTEKDCKYIMAPVNKAGLSLSGISSTIPTAIRVGPYNLGGLGILDPYVHMGVAKIASFLTNTWLQTPTGILMDTALDDILLEFGLASPLTRHKVQQGLLYATTPSWIRHMLSFTVEHEIYIALDTSHTISAKRQHDDTIMELALRYTTNKSGLQSINKVRMSLHVIWISDISTADGRHIDTRYLRKLDSLPSRNQYIWPCTHKVTSGDWTIWKRFLRQLCSNESWTLVRPLGQWLCRKQQWIEEWDCFLDRQNSILYVRTKDSKRWKRHVRRQGRTVRAQGYYKESLLYSRLPGPTLSLQRASIENKPTHITVTAYSSCSRWIPPADDENPWQHLSPTRDSIVTAIQTTCRTNFIDATEDIDILLQDFSNGTAVSVSDGSYFPTTSKAACAWTIESACRSQWIMAAMPVSGPPESFNSYRSELNGLLGITITIQIMASCCRQPRHIIIGCDGEAALSTLRTPKEMSSANTENIDLISAIVDTWKRLETQPLLVHIKGHQDEEKIALTRLEKMNILMDKLAKLSAVVSTNIVPPLSIMNTGLRLVRHNEHAIVGNIQRTLYIRLVAKKLFQYLGTKLDPTVNVEQSIAFSAFKRARANAPLYLNIFLSKWISDTLATGVNMQKRRQRIFNRCPRCNHWGEDRLHVVVCWDHRATFIWKKNLDRIKTFMTQEHTDPEITCFFVEGLESFRKSPTSGPTEDPGHQWQRELWSIGWLNVLAGFIPQSMVQQQQQYYTSIGSRRGSLKWAGNLIHHVWLLMHQMWLGRNEVLHQKSIINQISGSTLLDVEVEREFDKGCTDLPISIHKWFNQSKEELLDKSVEYKKGWLLVIKSVKESMQIADYSIFSSSKALRKWMGLHNK
jgi:Endonuclease/Exonuclease/phosphatase family./Reverse transcriptase (RNA-dependent DNA polymerase).